MEAVLADYGGKVDLMFLFANDSVLDFYPKFGFRQVPETVFTYPTNNIPADFQARKLKIQDVADMDIIRRLAANRQPLTGLFGARDYGHIFLWHALYILPEDLWYLADDDILIAACQEGDRLAIYDILSDHPFSFNAIISKIVRPETQHIDLYFSPDYLDMAFTEKEIYSESPLFLRGNFPPEGEQLKFPALAQT